MYGYNPYYNQPYMGANNAVPDTLSQLKLQQDTTNMVWVQGEAGAKSYMVAPGNEILLMDSEQSRFYIKSTAANRMPMPLRVFEFKEITNTQQMPVQSPTVDTNKYVTREEFEKVLKKLDALTDKEEEDE